MTRAAAALLLALTACGPSLADGSDGFGETGTDGEIVDEMPVPLGDPVCVEMTPGQTTCWVGWSVLDALVKLPCQVSDLVTSGAWSPATEVDLPGWGLVRCHEGTVQTCLYSPSNVVLTEESPGVWSPTTSAEVWQFAAVDPPCLEPPGEYETGGAWGPCPLDPVTGIHTLCTGLGTACVPTENATSAICLPMSVCPTSGPSESIDIDIFDVCVPHCTTDQDCLIGMVCEPAWADATLLCAWPI